MRPRDAGATSETSWRALHEACREGVSNQARGDVVDPHAVRHARRDHARGAVDDVSHDRRADLCAARRERHRHVRQKRAQLQGKACRAHGLVGRRALVDEGRDDAVSQRVERRAELRGDGAKLHLTRREAGHETDRVVGVQVVALSRHDNAHDAPLGLSTRGSAPRLQPPAR